MNQTNIKTLFFIIITLFSYFHVRCQNSFIISGIVTDTNKELLSGASIHLSCTPGGTMTKKNGSFSINAVKWCDTLVITHSGFEKYLLVLQKGQLTGLVIQMKAHVSLMNDVIINMNATDKEPGKRFMKKVIARKDKNNPDRFASYSYRQYKRHELDIDNLDSAKVSNKGLKNLTINIYRSIDTANANSPTLPLFFSETISENYHQLSPSLEKENLLAKKTLGLETDKILRRLDKFNFSFNIYDNWLSIFNQTYASPLSNSAFEYYNFYFSDSSVVNGNKVYKIHFSPRQKFERAFTGSLWINDSTYSIQKIDMRLSRTANLNFVNDLHFIQEYKLSLDAVSKRYEYMPYKYSSVINFETGLELLGIPLPAKANAARLVITNTVVIDHIKLNTDAPDEETITRMEKEATSKIEKDAGYWIQNRLDTLSVHEKDIYLMVDSLKKNRKYRNTTRIITAIVTDFWDVKNKVRIGPLTSLVSANVTEGIRSRVGFWTMPGISEQFNLHSYLAYGTKDKRLKWQLGVQYLWNSLKWTKTSLTAGSDYDYVTERDDEVDDDNLLASMLRKNIPSTNIYNKSITLKQEQYLTRHLGTKALLDYREILPVFPFSYHPLSKESNEPIDSINKSLLPVAQAAIGFRYTKKEKFYVFNYEQVKLNIYDPIFTVNFIYGLKMGKAQFTFKKINVGIEHKLKLPPKAIFYYRVTAGKTYGTAPYLLLDVPEGNEAYVDSRFFFNTMLPYEFASDQYVKLHTRLYTGGLFLDKIPFLNRMGIRERFSFNLFMGSMTEANKQYNSGAPFSVTGGKPFMEAGAGIENIFHLVSIDYFWRLSENNTGTPNGGLFLGMKLAF